MTSTTEQLADRRILLVGLGDLGAEIARRALTAGARVTGVRRGAAAPAGVALRSLDARDPAALAALPDAFDAAVLCVTPSAPGEAGYRDSYLAVARSFADRYRDGSIGRMFWISSSAVFGQGEGAEIDDDAVTEPGSFRGRVMLEAEAALAEGMPTTSLRLSGIYGPGRLALLRRVLEGRGAPAEPLHWTNRIHRDDAAAAVTFLLARSCVGDAVPERVLVTDPTPTPRHQVLAWLAERLGVRLEHEADGGPDRAPSRRMIPRRLLDLGYRFLHPDYRSGFEAIITAMESSGALDALRREVRGDGR
jgi:nucleoside-diphosphate-sugar epimerase